MSNNIEFLIKLSTIKDIQTFVKITNAFPPNVDIFAKHGRYVVDGRSIMGIFSLDILKPITIAFECEEPMDELETKMKFIQWMVEE